MQAGYFGGTYFGHHPAWITYAHRSECDRIDPPPTHWQPLPDAPAAAEPADEHERRHGLGDVPALEEARVAAGDPRAGRLRPLAPDQTARLRQALAEQPAADTVRIADGADVLTLHLPPQPPES